MLDAVSHAVNGAAIEVHRELGPSLLEALYERALAEEFRLRGIRFTRQTEVAAKYKGVDLGGFYRLDFMVENTVVVEVKAVQHILPVHRAQLLTYLRITGYEIGLILNFHAAVMKDGIVRMVRSPKVFASRRLPVQASSPHARCSTHPEDAGR